MSIGIFVALFIYICNIWWITFAIKGEYFSELNTRMLAVFAQALVVVLTPLMAFIAQRTSGGSLMRLGLALSVLTPPWLFYATVHHSLLGVAGGEIFYALCLAMVTATMFKYFTDIFPTAVRYTGQALAWSLGVAIFGGSAPLLAQILAARHLSFTALYVMLSSVAAWYATRSRRAQMSKRT